jgi:Xaa-Pro aminopeptidase
VTTLDRAAELERSAGRAPKPPLEEQRGRLQRARAAMERHGLEGLVVYGSAGVNADPIRYLSGYVHVFPGASSLLLLPLDGDPVLLVDQGWHLDEARRMSFVDDVRALPAPGRTWLADELRRTVADALSATGLAEERLGVFGAAMPIALAAPLEGATTADAAPVWEELVASPSAYDADLIRKTARVADEGLAAAIEAAGAGVPEYEMCLAALERMAAEGAEFLHGSGYSTHVNIGSFSDVVSNVRPYLFTTRRLEEGQMFWLDLSASFEGCYTDTDRTISVGEPTAAQRGLYEIAAEMYRVLLAGARPGVSGGDLWEAATRVAADAGLADHSNLVYLGHTTGITTSSRPVIAKGETAPIVEGSFLNVEPGIFVPGVGSACIENTLHVTESGARPINGYGLEIHVV